jgi:hypothetical protein
MASLKVYVEKLGKVRGRKEYNAFHRQYRIDNKKKFLKYWRDYRIRQKARIDGVSVGL